MIRKPDTHTALAKCQISKKAKDKKAKLTFEVFYLDTLSTENNLCLSPREEVIVAVKMAVRLWLLTEFISLLLI